MLKRTPGEWSKLIILVILGGLLLGYVGEFLSPYLPWLGRFNQGLYAGARDVSIDLLVVKLSFTFLVKVNLFTLVGFLAGFFAYNRIR